MKKFTKILESQESSKFIDDFKDAIVELFDKDLKIAKFYIKDFSDINGVYLYNIQISFFNNLNNKTYESYKKLFDIFYNNELDFSHADNVLTSTGLLGDLADTLSDLQTEIQSKKYNL